MSDTKELKEKKILAYLKVPGNKLTAYQASMWFGYTELRSYVCKLIKSGYDMARETVDGEKYKEYWIKEAA